MATYQWYATAVDSDGTATSDSVVVNVWVDTGPPPDPSLYDIIITDTNGDGLISDAEWSDYTGGGQGLNGGGVLTLFDGVPGGSGTLYSSVPYTTGDADLLDGLVKNFIPADPSDVSVPPPCFVAGTSIETANGHVLVENLKTGDLVITMDSGLQAIRWIGARKVTATGKLAPIVFQAGAVGNVRKLRVSPQHRMLITNWKAELYFGQFEVLVAAKHLINNDTIYQCATDEVEYFHLMFDKHEIIFAEDAPTESFYPGESAINTLNSAAREELFEIFPELENSIKSYGTTNRMCLKLHEGRLVALPTGL